MNLTELQNRANVLVETINEYESNLTGITVDENEILEQHIYLDTHSLCSIFNYIFGKNWNDKSTNNPESTLTNDYPFFITPFCKHLIVNLKDFKTGIEEKIMNPEGWSTLNDYAEFSFYTQGLSNSYQFIHTDVFNVYDTFYRILDVPDNSLHPYDAQLIESEVVNLRRIATETYTEQDTGSMYWIGQTHTGINCFTYPEAFGEHGQPQLTTEETSRPTNVEFLNFGTFSHACQEVECCPAGFPRPANDKYQIELAMNQSTFKIMIPPFTHYCSNLAGNLSEQRSEINNGHNDFLRATPNWGPVDRETFNENNWWDTVHTWFELATKQRRAGCKAAGVDFLPGSGDTDDQGVALAVILAHCKPVLENFYFPDNLEKFYSEDGSKAAELADLFLTTCDTDSDITDEAFFTTDNTTADTETGEQNTDRSCKNRFTYEMLANVYDLPL